MNGIDVIGRKRSAILCGGFELIDSPAFRIRGKTGRIHAVESAVVPAHVVDADTVETCFVSLVENFVCRPVRRFFFVYGFFRLHDEVAVRVFPGRFAHGVDVVFPDDRADEFFHFRRPPDFFCQRDKSFFLPDDSAIPFGELVIVRSLPHSVQMEFPRICRGRFLEQVFHVEDGFAGMTAVDVERGLLIAVIFLIDCQSSVFRAENAEDRHVRRRIAVTDSSRSGLREGEQSSEAEREGTLSSFRAAEAEESVRENDLALFPVEIFHVFRSEDDVIRFEPDCEMKLQIRSVFRFPVLVFPEAHPVDEIPEGDMDFLIVSAESPFRVFRQGKRAGMGVDDSEGIFRSPETAVFQIFETQFEVF